VWNPFLSLVPGTPNEQRKFRTGYKSSGERQLMSFKKLSSLSPELQQSLEPSVVRYQGKLAAMVAWEARVRGAWLGIYTIAAAVNFYATPFLAVMWRDLGFLSRLDLAGRLTLWLTLEALYLTIFALAVIFLLWLEPRLRQQLGERNRRGIFLTLLACSALLYALTLPAWNGPFGMLIYAMRVGILGMIAQAGTFVFVFAPGVLLINHVFNRRKAIRYPDALLVDGLINILLMVEEDPEHWTELSFKRRLLGRLEEISICVERALPRQLRSGDDLTDIWLSEKAAQFAAALRDKKKWVLTPKLDTRDAFIRCMRHYLIIAAVHDWDSLERITPEQLSRPRAWQSRATTALRTLVVAGMPLAGLWLIQQTSFLLAGTIAEYATAGALLWAMLALITTLDPQFQTKIAAIKDVSSLLARSDSGTK
jgi:hypothetical protein